MEKQIIEILIPTAKAIASDLQLTPRVDNLDGKVIGLLNNGKPNFDVFLSNLRELLSQKLPSTMFNYIKKGEGLTSAGFPFALEKMDKFVAQCDVVINGMCDWGGCTSWSIHDSVELEKRGVATVTICSDQFESLARSVAQAKQLNSLPLAIIPHPLGGLTIDEIEAKAVMVVDEVIRLLTGSDRNKNIAGQ